MMRILREMANGLGTHHGVRGMAEHGGRATTLAAMMKRGLIDQDYHLTEQGKVMVSEPKPEGGDE